MYNTALIIAVGKGSGTENGIIYSIKNNNPDKIVFLYSSESLEKLICILGKLKHEEPNFFQAFLDEAKLNSKDFCDIDNEAIKTVKLRMDEIEDFRPVYRKCVLIIEELEKLGFKNDNIIVDFTFGTKAITAGLIVASIFKKIKKCTYVGSGGEKRSSNGIVISGSENLNKIEPRIIYDDYNFEYFKSYFNSYKFAACMDLIESFSDRFFIRIFNRNKDSFDSAEKDIDYAHIIKSCFKKLVDGYYFWDKFDYESALERLKKIGDYKVFLLQLDLETFNKNIEFIENIVRLKKQGNKYPQDIAVDLFLNSIRREKEDKFDDALIRCYRIIEYISQSVLFNEFGIDVGNVDLNKLKIILMQRNFSSADKDFDYIKKNIISEITKRIGNAYKKTYITSGLQKNYKLLNILKHPLGIKFENDPEINNKLEIRNKSILIHGLDPINKKNFDNLKEWVNSYLVDFLGNKKYEELFKFCCMANFIN